AESARGRLPLVHFAGDSLWWMIAIPFCTWLRYDFSRDHLDSEVFDVDDADRLAVMTGEVVLGGMGLLVR
ncbi:MAG: hypothetical protein WBP59_11840, partial [Ilumatobacteraceae bacterium]